jgi:hypothetical protein
LTQLIIYRYRIFPYGSGDFSKRLKNVNTVLA